MAAVAEQAIAAEDQFGRCAITAEDQFGRCAIAAEDQFGRCETAAPAECQGEMSHLLSKLNPAAKEFFPSNYTSAGSQKSDDRLSSVAPVFVAASAFYGYGPASNGGSSRDSSSDGSANNQPNRRVISSPFPFFLPFWIEFMFYFVSYISNVYDQSNILFVRGKQRFWLYSVPKYLI